MNVYPRVCCCSPNMIVGDFSGNADKILQQIETAKRRRANVAVFPELAMCGYNPRDLLWVPEFVSRQYDELLKLAAKITDIIAVVGFAEMFNGHLYNSAAVISGGQIVATARKKHLVNEGFINEPRYFTPGEGAAYFKIVSATLKVVVNEDVYFEEGVSEASAICVCGAYPFYKEPFNNLPHILQYHASTQEAAILYANYCGGYDESVFSGESCIYAKDGNLISRSPSFEEGIAFADIVLDDKNVEEAPVLMERMGPKTMDFVSFVIPQEDEEHRILRALVLGVKDYAQKCGFKQLTLGLSGGVDSSLVACIAVLALGAENVKGVVMPSRFSSKHSITDARYLTEMLEIKWDSVPIEPILKAYEESLPQEFGEEGLAQQNIQARIRANVLMGFSNKYGYMILTTGNKSETFAGYSTLYGDAAGAYAPLKDIPKTLVYKLCKVANEILGKEVINESVLTKAPSAELAPNQKDSDSLPEYEQLDAILQSYVEEGKDFAEIAKDGQDESLARKLAARSLMYEYKLRQMPMGVAVTPVSLNNNRVVPAAHSFKP